MSGDCTSDMRGYSARARVVYQKEESEDMAEHKHGDMDIAYHERTFQNFLRVCAITAVITVLILIFLAIVGT